MSRVGKNSLSRENFHLKPLPQDFLNRISGGQNKGQVKNIWLENIGIHGLSEENHCLEGKEFRTVPPEDDPTITSVALKALLPGDMLGKVIEVQNLADKSFEDRVVKEHAFKNLIQKQFDIHQVMTDSNNGIRAIIRGLNPDLDPNSEEITAVILRGDLVEYVMKHPEHVRGGNDPDVLKGYCFEMSRCDMPIGLEELGIFSEILESPIHIYRFDDAHSSNSDKISAGEKSIYGSQYSWKTPIHIYYDPVRSEFYPLQPKKPKKFGLLKD